MILKNVKKKFVKTVPKKALNNQKGDEQNNCNKTIESMEEEDLY